MPDAHERWIGLSSGIREDQRLEVAICQRPLGAWPSRPLPIKIWQCGAEQHFLAHVEVPAM